MGPRFNGVEDVLTGGIASLEYAPLQWGHALMAWKTSKDLRRRQVYHLASMGPRFNGVEDKGTVSGLTRRFCASMGPRFNGVEDQF